MTTLIARNIANIAEMWEPHKVLENSVGKPVDISQNSVLVSYFVAAEAISMTSIVWHHFMK